MEASFANLYLRIPQGFATVLEGLTREILREQPEDIPEFAARYFAAFLQQREDSGMDPAEWNAKLEDKHTFDELSKTVREMLKTGFS